ncbi:hypothetical protein GCM10022407_14490 [Hymenobacter antarcticus]|uniref:Uncharacterized protein n=1 Tax=Hymenobacter antarcticus TaxID=486270 RepID=A0ABP7PQN6_9BACT
MGQYVPYFIGFGSLRQFVGDLSRLLAALWPVTRVQVCRLQQRPLAPLLVTVFVRHESHLPTPEALYAAVESLRPGALTVRCNISPVGRRWGFPYAALVQVYVYDQPVPAGFRLLGR